MSGGGDAVPRGTGGRVPTDLAAATPDPGAVRHGYDLRPKRKATQVADPLGDAVPAVVAPGEGEEANHRQVGGRDARAEADAGGSSNESGDSGGESSGDQSERYALRSEASEDWLESRSRVTTPGSSTPSSPRRRTSVGDQTPYRNSVPALSTPLVDRSHPRGGRSREVREHRQPSSPVQEYEDPADLAARSSRLIEQLQRFIREREQALPSPANEPFKCGDRLASGGAKARTGGRHGPQAPQLFGNAAAEPGRLPSETARVEGRYAREEADWR